MIRYMRFGLILKDRLRATVRRNPGLIYEVIDRRGNKAAALSHPAERDISE